MPKVVKQITIALLEDGNLGLEGPVRDEPLCIWMLERAKLEIMLKNKADAARAMNHGIIGARPVDPMLKVAKGGQ